jgi:hypothetical protein
MYLRMLLVICWLICSSVVQAPNLKPVFGVLVRFQTGTTMYCLVAFLDDGRALTYKKILTKDDFVKIASGYWPSIYNPTRENFFRKNKLFCGMYNDSIHIKDLPICMPLDSLWKIRFSDYPFINSSEKGWSNGLNRPSIRQAEYLRTNYKVDDVDLNYFLDTNFWHILRDIQDTTWIANYKSLK